jgi:hypothetical protein
MRPLLLVLALAAPASAQTILDLDRGYPEDQFYTLTYNAPSAFTLTSVADGYDGRAAEARWRIEAGAGGLGFAGFGYLHGVAAPPNPFPDLAGATHLGLWVNNVEPASGAERVAFRFELHERDVETDPDGFRGSQVWVWEAPDVLARSPGWFHLLIPLRQVEAVGEEGFAVLPGGFEGDGRLDLDAVKHWSVLLLVEGAPVGTVVEGRTRFDLLTAETRPVAGEPDAPLEDALLPASPNPFTTSTALAYTLGQPAEVSLRVLDVLGRDVAVLAEGRRAAGRHRVVLNGAGLAAGTYVLVLDVDGRRLTRRATLGR